MPATESPNAEHEALDTYATLAVARALIDDQAHAVAAVQAAAAALAQAVDAALPRIRHGGRLVYVGAGTSGRLGLLDSVELLPTFSWEPERAIALLAGGERAIRRAVEGAEDSAEQGAEDVMAHQVDAQDVVLLIAASGSTPYALGALQAARRVGALTIALANNPDAPLTAQADVGITLDTGPEVISGSTRLKAGTAQKIALNTFSSALMVRLNKVYGNLMVDLKPTNAKLHRRCLRLTMLATGCDEHAARTALADSGHHVKTAIVMIRQGLSAEAARERLQRMNGSVRQALGEDGE
ncbi:MAG: N-acetylmuramic acid 6-phosphate etherase [Rubrivivax sp.]|nr:N-acetylmuramic acid 6-phosphate etherase [Rubrivivax sp.]